MPLLCSIFGLSNLEQGEKRTSSVPDLLAQSKMMAVQNCSDFVSSCPRVGNMIAFKCDVARMPLSFQPWQRAILSGARMVTSVPQVNRCQHIS